MMKFNDQNRYCHPERSEGSLCPSRQILRFAQDDKLLPILFVKTHYRPMGRRCAPQADKSAVCTINDSVGKFCKHVRTSPFSERRTEHYEKNLHMQRKRAAILAPPSCLCSCSSHAEDEYAASRAAKAGSCLVPALVSLSVQSFPTES